MDWTTLTAAGAFIAGVAVGVIGTIRVAKVVATYLTQLRHNYKESPDEHDPHGSR